MTRFSWTRAARALAFASLCLAIGFALGWTISRRFVPAPAIPAAVPGEPSIAARASATHPAATTHDASPALPEVPLAQRVVIISIDGLRPDLLVRGEAPQVRQLLAASAFTFWARTVEHPYVYTLPAHVTMLTGVNPDRHGVTWNHYIEWYPNVPTLFEHAKARGLTTAMTTGKMKFVALNKPGTLDWVYLPPDEPVSDRTVALEAVRILRDHRPHVLFVHLPGVDSVGHEHGWGSPEQLAAVAAADAAAALVVAALDELNLADSTLLILTADHGGAALAHWGDDPRSRTIPWIARGPGIRRGFDLTRHPGLEVQTADTFATAAAALGLPLPPDCEGRFVAEMLDPRDRELLQDAHPNPTTRP
jgi:hypothetical protein